MSLTLYLLLMLVMYCKLLYYLIFIRSHVSRVRLVLLNELYVFITYICQPIDSTVRMFKNYRLIILTRFIKIPQLMAMGLVPCQLRLDTLAIQKWHSLKESCQNKLHLAGPWTCNLLCLLSSGCFPLLSCEMLI